MAKLLKSIFGPNEKRKEFVEEEISPPLDGRRKLSISRSGRMKANKKRHMIAVDLYSDDLDIHTVEKPKSIEYHVNPISAPKPKDTNKSLEDPTKNVSKRDSVDVKTPEEEIDSAFEIIDKVKI